MLRNLLLAALLIAPLGQANGESILNVSYDVTREFFKEYNQKFVNYWQQKNGQTLTINQSHGGSTKQALAVADGLEADVITMNQPGDIDILYQRGIGDALLTFENEVQLIKNELGGSDFEVVYPSVSVLV
ncbi:MAG: hypothetical protein LBE21_06485, partial [Pseudomonadales bacterium]|nr:hypothetical protein [Pseudomonadales bacterium]